MKPLLILAFFQAAIASAGGRCLEVSHAALSSHDDETTFSEPFANYAGETYYLAPEETTAAGYCALQGFYSLAAVATCEMDASNPLTLLNMDSLGDFSGLSSAYSTRISSITCSLSH